MIKSMGRDPSLKENCVLYRKYSSQGLTLFSLINKFVQPGGLLTTCLMSECACFLTNLSTDFDNAMPEAALTLFNTNTKNIQKLSGHKLSSSRLFKKKYSPPIHSPFLI